MPIYFAPVKDQQFILHDVLKLYKHGYSKVTDHASREIRHGRISREEGLILVKKHEHLEPEYLNFFQDCLDFLFFF